MSRRLRLPLGLALVTTAAAALALALILTSDHPGNRVVNAVLVPLVGWSFAASGLVAWWRRPANGIGRLLLVVSFTWSASSALAFSNESLLYTVGRAGHAIVLAAFAHLLLSFPSGSLRSRFERALVVSAYALAVVANVSVLLVTREFDCPSGQVCPRNRFLVTPSATATQVLGAFFDTLAVVALGLAGVLLVRHWWKAGAAGRRIWRRIYIVGAAALVLLAAAFAAAPFSTGASDLLQTVGLLVFATVPFLVLGGILGSRLARIGVEELLAAVGRSAGDSEAEEGMRRALRDPELQLALWLPEEGRFAGVDGRPFELPAPGGRRVASTIESEQGEMLAAFVHDVALREEPELLASVAAAARLALQRTRLQSELEARLVELERERDFIRDVVNAAPAFFVVLDLEGRVVRFNKALERASGIPDDDRVRGRPFADLFVAPEDRDRAGELLAEAAPGRHEHRWLGSGEAELVVEWSAMRIGDALGRQRLLVTGLDVSERVQHEEEVRRERDFLASVGRATPSLLCVVHADGTVDRRGVNAAFTAATGVDDEAAVGRCFWDLVIPADDVDRVRTAFLAAVETGTEVRLETPWRAAGGGTLVVEWWTSSLAGYRPGHFLICGSDITKRKRDEDEVRRSRARLVEAAGTERRRLERNLHDGAQQRLVSLSLALRLAESAIGANPDRARELLTGASAELALALEELRELARGIHPAVLSDRGLAPALEALAERAVVPVELQLELADRLPEPVEVAIFYVVSEALANIGKYAHASSALVRVAHREADVLVAIVDDGIGGADPHRGTGLRGLADRVAALDGEIDVSSPPGRGTTVRAVLPLAVAEPAATDAGT